MEYQLKQKFLTYNNEKTRQIIGMLKLFVWQIGACVCQLTKKSTSEPMQFEHKCFRHNHHNIYVTKLRRLISKYKGECVLKKI